MSQTIEESQEAAPNLFQAIAPVVFQPDTPAFSPSVLLGGYKWPALTARSDIAHAAPALTDTAAPDPATPAAIGSGKINSNCARQTDGQTASPSPPTDPYSDVTLVSIGGSDDDSDYVDSAKDLPTSPANTPDLAVNISKL